MSAALRTPTADGRQNEKEERTLRRDRIIGIVVVLILTAVLAAMVWLASVSGITPSENYFDDYWLMP